LRPPEPAPAPFGAVRLAGGGHAFRVWAPHADAVSVVGDWNGFDAAADPLRRDDHGCWYGEAAAATVGHEYRFAIRNGDRAFTRIDPYARRVTNSIGNAVIEDPREFDWGDDAAFERPSWNTLVVYELHVGTFARSEPGRPGTFDDAARRLRHLRALGINAVELMPVAEFAGDVSWGYNPSHPFAIETAYGGPAAFRRFVKAAHALGIAVILDVVYNHFGPTDLDLWQFDGWSENDKGGIYFYNDWRSHTPWGDTRPDYGRGEVRRYLHDNAMMWLDEYHVDGLRYDMTLYMRSVAGNGDDEIADGWTLAQWINRDIRARFPGRITIAEDLRSNAAITNDEDEGGANFASQWDEGFVHPVRAALVAADDAHRDMHAVRAALLNRYGSDAFRRVVYTESHDEVANGRARVNYEIDANDPAGFFALKRSTLGAGLVLTAPGIPMLFQGQTHLEEGWFDDTAPVDWEKVRRFPGVARMYRDLIHLRRNLGGDSAGLTGHDILVHHVDDAAKVIAYLRRADGGPAGDTLVVANFAVTPCEGRRVGVPQPGEWVPRFNSDWAGYREDLGDFPVLPVVADDEPCDGLPASAVVAAGAYSLSVYAWRPAPPP
jgi:1,4-alpha-glucan branching enzyme